MLAPHGSAAGSGRPAAIACPASEPLLPPILVQVWVWPMSHLRRNQKEKERRKAPELHALLEARDYTGAITLIEFNRKVFHDAKHSSGWREGATGFDWVEGSRQPLTEQERKQDEQQCLWLAYAAFHNGDYKKALDAYQAMIDQGSLDQVQGSSSHAACQRAGGKEAVQLTHPFTLLLPCGNRRAPRADARLAAWRAHLVCRQRYKHRAGPRGGDVPKQKCGAKLRGGASRNRSTGRS